MLEINYFLIPRTVFLLASCLIYAWALLEYVIFIVWVHSVNKIDRDR